MALGIIGLPIPDETILTFAGYLILQNNLHLIPTIFSAYLGSISGISLSFFIGRTFGLKFLHKHGSFFHITEKRLQKTKRWFESYGEWLFLFGYFIPGVRHLTALIAGSADTKYSKFALFAYTGGLFWTLTFVLVGLNVGKEWDNIIMQIHTHIKLFILSLIILIVIIVGVKKFFNHLMKKSDKE